jgi:hypothetical protein
LTYHVCPPDEAPAAVLAEPAGLIVDPDEPDANAGEFEGCELELLDVWVTG